MMCPHGVIPWPQGSVAIIPKFQLTVSVNSEETLFFGCPIGVNLDFGPFPAHIIN